MYRQEAIEKLFGRVGFRELVAAGYIETLDPINKESRSGRYFDGFHAAVTLDNIRQAVSSEPWASDENFNQTLTLLQKDCIASVLDGIFNEPEVIEQQMEFDSGEGNRVLIPNAGRFVGRRVVIASDPRKSVNVNAIALLFDSDVTFNLYLFNSLKKDPIETIEVNAVSDNQVVIPVDWILNYMNTSGKSGQFYIGYFQNDLGNTMAYDEQPCQWMCGKVYGSSPIEADAIGTNDFVRSNPYISNRTFGVNIEFSSVVDFTEVIIRNQQAFDKAIGLQMAAMVVERIIHSSRSNLTQRMSEADTARLYNDLNLDMQTPELPYSSGLKNQLRRELKRLHDNFFPEQQAISTTIQPSCFIPRAHR